jgi:hypothetical protein
MKVDKTAGTDHLLITNGHRLDIGVKVQWQDHLVLVLKVHALNHQVVMMKFQAGEILDQKLSRGLDQTLILQGADLDIGNPRETIQA